MQLGRVLIGLAQAAASLEGSVLGGAAVKMAPRHATASGPSLLISSS